MAEERRQGAAGRSVRLQAVRKEDTVGTDTDRIPQEIWMISCVSCLINCTCGAVYGLFLPCLLP